ncbi:MAG: MMPL family transporter [Thermotogota bacterium]|nr:MMPL family transporter [Thermotogota bacterium]
MRQLSNFINNYKIPIVAFFISMSILGAYLSSKLMVNSDFMRILPPDDPVVQKYEDFSVNNNSSNISYVVLKTDLKNQDGITALKATAEKIFNSTEEFSHIESMVRFDIVSNQGPLGLLLLNPDQIRDFSIGEEILPENPDRLLNYDFSVLREIGLSIDSFKQISNRILNENENKHFENYIRMPEHFPEEDPMILVMGFKLDRPSTNISYVQKVTPQLREWVEGKIDDRNVYFNMTGDHFSTYEAHQQAQFDFTLTTIISLMGIALLFFLAYSSIRITFFMFSSLAVSMFLTLGISYVIFGELNIVTTFLNAITLGLGIDYGIHIITRMADESKRTGDPVEILHRTYRATTTPLLVSALTTGFVFLIISFVNAPAIRELGVLTALGILVFFAVMYFFLPALSITSISKGGSSAKIHSLDKYFYFLSRLGKKYSGISLAIVVVLIVFLSYFGVHNIRNFSYTPPGLISKDSETMDSLRLIERVFGSELTNNVPFFADNIEGLQEISDRLKENKNIDSVTSILDLLGEDEADFLENFRQVLRSMETFRDSPVVESLLKKNQYYSPLVEFVQKAENTNNTSEILDLMIGYLPEDIRRQLYYVTPKGEDYFVLLAEPSLRIYQENGIKKLFDSLDELQNEAGGYPKVYYHMMNLVRKITTPVSLFALGFVFFIIYLERRSIFDSIKLIILVIGVLLSMFGVMEIMGIETTFVTIISAPLILGIGVDGMVHMIHGASKGKRYESARTLKSVTMSAVTTMFAFMSFGLAQGRLLRYFGLSLSGGVLISLIVATFAVPVIPWKRLK